MVINIKKTIFFILLFFTFNLLHIDSNSYKKLIYNKNDLYTSDFYTIYFVNTNTKELKNKLKLLNMELTSVIVDNKKYYARNIDVFEDKFLKNKSIEDNIYYKNNGINIDAINVSCTNNDLILLENMISIY